MVIKFERRKKKMKYSLDYWGLDKVEYYYFEAPNDEAAIQKGQRHIEKKVAKYGPKYFNVGTAWLFAKTEDTGYSDYGRKVYGYKIEPDGTISEYTD
jgi:hypothetical protein